MNCRCAGSLEGSDGFRQDTFDSSQLWYDTLLGCIECLEDYKIKDQEFF